MNEPWYEIVPPSLKRGGVFIPLHVANKPPAWLPRGYLSVYGFTQEHAAEIMERGNSRGLSQYPVFADRVILDLDGGKSELREAEAVLHHLGLGYDVWDSGYKGYHVVIPHAPIWSPDLPHSHKCWVVENGLPHDPSLYQHGRILSMPGRIHKKTGLPKTLGKQIGGMMPEIPIKKAPSFNFSAQSGGDLKSALIRIVNLIVAEPGPGKRHTALWSAAKNMADAGIDYNTTSALLLQVNAQWEHPKPEDEALRAIQGAYE